MFNIEKKPSVYYHVPKSSWDDEYILNYISSLCSTDYKSNLISCETLDDLLIQLSLQKIQKNDVWGVIFDYYNTDIIQKMNTCSEPPMENIIIAWSDIWKSFEFYCNTCPNNLFLTDHDGTKFTFKEAMNKIDSACSTNPNNDLSILPIQYENICCNVVLDMLTSFRIGKPCCVFPSSANTQDIEQYIQDNVETKSNNKTDRQRKTLQYLCTSGTSSGKPKLCAVEERHMYIPLSTILCATTQKSRMLFVGSPNFAGCIRRIWMNIMMGKSMIMYPLIKLSPNTLNNIDKYLQLPKENFIKTTDLSLTPSIIRYIHSQNITLTLSQSEWGVIYVGGELITKQISNIVTQLLVQPECSLSKEHNFKIIHTYSQTELIPLFLEGGDYNDNGIAIYKPCNIYGLIIIKTEDENVLVINDIITSDYIQEYSNGTISIIGRATDIVKYCGVFVNLNDVSRFVSYFILSEYGASDVDVYTLLTKYDTLVAIITVGMLVKSLPETISYKGHSIDIVQYSRSSKSLLKKSSGKINMELLQNIANEYIEQTRRRNTLDLECLEKELCIKLDVTKSLTFYGVSSLKLMQLSNRYTEIPLFWLLDENKTIAHILSDIKELHSSESHTEINKWKLTASSLGWSLCNQFKILAYDTVINNFKKVNKDSPYPNFIFSAFHYNDTQKLTIETRLIEILQNWFLRCNWLQFKLELNESKQSTGYLVRDNVWNSPNIESFIKSIIVYDGERNVKNQAWSTVSEMYIKLSEILVENTYTTGQLVIIGVSFTLKTIIVVSNHVLVDFYSLHAVVHLLKSMISNETEVNFEKAWKIVPINEPLISVPKKSWEHNLIKMPVNSDINFDSSTLLRLNHKAVDIEIQSRTNFAKVACLLSQLINSFVSQYPSYNQFVGYECANAYLYPYCSFNRSVLTLYNINNEDQTLHKMGTISDSDIWQIPGIISLNYAEHDQLDNDLFGFPQIAEEHFHRARQDDQCLVILIRYSPIKGKMTLMMTWCSLFINSQNVESIFNDLRIALSK